MTAGRTTVVLIAGSRAYPDPITVTQALARYVLTEAPGWVIVRHGDCPDPFYGDQLAGPPPLRSVDQIVSDWVKDCEALGVSEDPMPADWDHCYADCPPGHRIKKMPLDTFHPGRLSDYCPWAGPRRNADMIRRTPRPDLMLAFPTKHSRGTRNCMRQAREAGIPVYPGAFPQPQSEAALF